MNISKVLKKQNYKNDYHKISFTTVQINLATLTKNEYIIEFNRNIEFLNENIGFLNPESGQMQTYGSSVNNFLVNELKRAQPRHNVVEIGCGAGLRAKRSVGPPYFSIFG